MIGATMAEESGNGNNVSPAIDSCLLENQREISEALELADKLRDTRRWSEAASAYQKVVTREPRLAPIWVQLGHALKESGQWTEAELAYRNAIRLAPGIADSRHQLGHLLKLSGRRQDAIEAYSEALRIDPEFRPAMTELTALGVRWRSENEDGKAARLLQDALATLEQIRHSLTTIEAQLPALGSLATVAVDNYDLFRHNFSVGMPPAYVGAPKTFSIIVLDSTENNISGILHLCHSIERQTVSPTRVTFLTTSEENAKCFDRVRGGSGLRLETALTVGSLREQWALVSEISARDAEEWVLIIPTTVVLCSTTLAWFAFAVSFETVALYADEDHVSFHLEGHRKFTSPVFKTTFDPLLLDEGGNYGDVVAVRRDVLHAALARLLAGPVDVSTRALLQCVREWGSVGHIPRVLSSRQNPASESAGDSVVTQVSRCSSTGGLHRIRVVVPTRDQRALLHKCIESLQAKAQHPDRIEFLIIDNGSDDPDTLSYLAALQERDRISVMRDERPFNWSLLNNTGVQESNAELFVFCNDDIEMLSLAWDLHLDASLAMKGIGAVGAKLLYPDGRIQHAGVLFGPQGRTEHEGINQHSHAPGPQGRWVRRRKVGAVSGAFLACPAEFFREAGGFDTLEFPIWFGDIDFCLRLRSRGREILFDPNIWATHHESKTARSTLAPGISDQYWRYALERMHERWGCAMIEDPGFNPYYSRLDAPFSAITEPSLDVIEAYIKRSLSVEPWRVG